MPYGYNTPITNRQWAWPNQNLGGGGYGINMPTPPGSGAMTRLSYGNPPPMPQQQRFYQGPPTSRVNPPPGNPGAQGMAGNAPRMGALGAAGSAQQAAAKGNRAAAAPQNNGGAGNYFGYGGSSPGPIAAQAPISGYQQQQAPAAAQDDGIRKDSNGRHIVYNDGFWDYNDAGYKVDSNGNQVTPGGDRDGINDRVERPIFGQMQKAGLIPSGVTWNMFKRGEWRPGMPAPGGAPAPTPTPPPGTPVPPTPPTPTPPPGGSGYQYQYNQITNPTVPDASWWQNAGNLNALQYGTNAANSLNNWNMDIFGAGWGVDMDRFAGAQSNAALMADYNTNLNNLDYNYYAANLDAGLGALGYQSNLYGGMNNSYNDMFGQMYYGDTQLAGNYLNSGSNLANTYAQTGLGYANLTNDWDVAQMQALADWYNNQARNQTDLQVATMQAFGRDQAPNTRFMQNWG